MKFAIDVDGVLLDYNQSFKKQFDKIFSVDLQLKEVRAHHAHNYWYLPNIDWKKEFFRKSGDMWREMPPIANSVAAINRLVDAGHEVVCVTSMPSHFQKSRLYNLQREGFQIHNVIATSRVGRENPKKKYIDELQPDYFIDDLLKNFEGIDSTKTVYVDNNYSDEPCKDWLHIKPDYTVSSLAAFVDNILAPKLKLG